MQEKNGWGRNEIRSVKFRHLINDGRKDIIILFLCVLNFFIKKCFKGMQLDRKNWYGVGSQF